MINILWIRNGQIGVGGLEGSNPMAPKPPTLRKNVLGKTAGHSEMDQSRVKGLSEGRVGTSNPPTLWLWIVVAAKAALAATPPPRHHRGGDDVTARDGMAKPRCPRCGSTRWVSVSLNGGYTRVAQCVPCGAYHEPVIGPGWKSPRFRDSEAVHPDYRERDR